MKKSIVIFVCIALSAACSRPYNSGIPARSENHPSDKSAEVRDVFCGMTIDANTAEAKTVYRGKTYYFCSRLDKERFEKSPDRYVPAEEKTKR